MIDTTLRDTVEALQKGTVTIKGEFLWGSNYTFLARVETSDAEIPVVYKPARGERPLWDFPAASLARRETAAFYVSEALGWRFVPATVYRNDAPFGPGSLQLFIDHDPQYHYFIFSKEDVEKLRPVVLYDLLINNADRKGSHIIFDKGGKFWLIDHGLCFHVEDKLRTVIWDFVGEPIPGELCGDLENFIHTMDQSGGKISDLRLTLEELLSPEEIIALVERARQLVLSPRFPAPDLERRPFPWPQI